MFLKQGFYKQGGMVPHPMFAAEGEGGGGSSETADITADNPEVQKLIDEALKNADTDTNGLKKSNARLLSEKKALQQKMDALSGDDEELSKLREEKAKREEEKQKAAGDYESLKKQLVENHQKELGEKDNRINFLTKNLEHNVVTAVLNDEIVKAGGHPDYIAHAIRRQVRMKETEQGVSAEVVDAEGNPRVTGPEGTAMSVQELVAQFKSEEKWGGAFAASGAGGAGTPPGGAQKPPGANTMKREAYNALGNSNPKEFERITKLVREKSFTIT